MEYRQGTLLFHRDGRGRSLIAFEAVCPECGEPTRQPHHHLSVGVAAIVRELKRAAAAPQPEPVGVREHLTLRQLADYSGRSARWLRARTKDARDPLPCAKPRGGKMTFKRADYEKWLDRRRPDATAAVVASLMARLGKKRGRS